MYLDWFVGTMKKTFNIVVKREDVGYEVHDFYHEEVDDLLIPAEHLEKLPNPLLIEAISYVDDKGYEWIANYNVPVTSRKFLFHKGFPWVSQGSVHFCLS
jgi:hypothetical protein